MVHIIIPEHAASACNMQVFEIIQVIEYLITKTFITDLEQRICLGCPDHNTAEHLAFCYQAQPLQVIYSNMNKPSVALIPYLITHKTEKFYYDKCLALWSHLFAPVCGFMYPSKRYLLFRDINPVLISNILSIDH